METRDVILWLVRDLNLCVSMATLSKAKLIWSSQVVQLCVLSFVSLRCGGI